MLKPQRKITRLGQYDYRAAGAYFCTLCVHRQWRRRDVWGRIEGGQMHLNRYGRIVMECWDDLPNHHAGLLLDAFVVMPNHVHGVLFLPQGQSASSKAKPESGRTFGPLDAGSLSVVLGSFKAAVTRRTNALRESPVRLWQPRFYERIVRDERELDNIRLYIHKNPLHWDNDEHHP